jgi:non-ribosomal peptide synthetase component F
VSEEGSVTYAELNDRAERIARYLRAQGVQEGMFVPLCMRRSIEMIVGILGVLKAGAAYVPLDSDYPKERLRMILEEIDAPMILSCAASVGNLPKSGAKVVCLDRDGQEIAREGEQPFRVNGSGEGVACVIFTSGSTGTPKGVMVLRAIASLVLNTIYQVGSLECGVYL